MATWKKVAVSGSDISQFNNDAGYLTSVTPQHAFTTASFDGTKLLADSAQGDLTFASSSGQGLTISANAGSDTLTFGLSNIPNASLTNSTISGVSLGGNLNDLTVDNSSLELNTGTTFNGSAARTISVKDGGITNTMLVNDGFDLGNTTITLGGTTTTVDGLTLTAVEATGSFTGSFTGDGSGLTGLASTLTIDADAGGTGTVNLLTQTFDVAGGTNINTSLSGQTITVNLDSNITVTDAVVNGDLTVLGTASFQNTENLQVADRFILLASGSNSNGDGGFVVQQTTQDVGELFGYDSSTTRWAVDSAFDATTSTFTPEAFMAAALVGSGTDPNGAGAPAARYSAKGNVYVGTDEGIWIYS